MDMSEDKLDGYIKELKMNEYLEIPRDEYLETIEPVISASPTCWGTLPDEEFMPAFESVPQVPAGIYEIKWNRDAQKHTLKKH